MITVARLSIAPVKGLRLLHPDAVEIGPSGVAGDRVFYLVDAEGRLANGKLAGELVQAEARFDVASDRLTLTLPGGAVVEADAGEGALGAAVETSFYGRPVTGRLVEGGFSAALSVVAGREVRLVRADAVGAACDLLHPVSLLGRGSCEELARRSGNAALGDDRRFRMQVVLAGTRPHEEDEWAGRRVRVGEVLLAVAGDVGRCVITGHDPDTGRTDADTLKEIAAYRGSTAGRISFGRYADVVEPGRIAVGDRVALA